MRGKISCSAQKLSMLEPAMIQSVVEPSAFQIANHYLAENRVRIVEADDNQISSVVIGNSGVYDQTIRLKDGSLTTKCSCTLSEQPFCRHSIAVLLGYHRWVRPKGVQRTSDPPAQERSVPQPTPSTPALDIKLSEVTVFVEWFQAVVKSLEGGLALPTGPNIRSGEVCVWIQAIQKLEERRRAGEEKQQGLQADLRDRNDQLDHLNQQLQNAVHDATNARAKIQNLERELEAHAELFMRLGELTREIERVDTQIKSLTGDLIHKASQLDRLGNSAKETSTILPAAHSR